MDYPLMLVVAGLGLAGAGAGWVLVEVLRRRRRAALRAMLVALFIGLAGAEAAMAPAFVVAVAGGEYLSLAGIGYEAWLVGAFYVVVTAYVLARLFPWREVDAMAADPNARLRDVMASLMAAEKEPPDRP